MAIRRDKDYVMRTIFLQWGKISADELTMDEVKGICESILHHIPIPIKKKHEFMNMESINAAIERGATIDILKSLCSHWFDNIYFTLDKLPEKMFITAQTDLLLSTTVTLNGERNFPAHHAENLLVGSELQKILNDKSSHIDYDLGVVLLYIKRQLGNLLNNGEDEEGE